jgi:hypothetical protein
MRSGRGDTVEPGQRQAHGGDHGHLMEIAGGPIAPDLLNGEQDDFRREAGRGWARQVSRIVSRGSFAPGVQCLLARPM